jgi:hypothetical protein
MDRALARRLSGLLEAVPVTAPSTAIEIPRSRVTTRLSVGLTSLAVVLVMLMAALALGNRGPAVGGPVVGVATDGPFKLTITVPHGRYGAGDSITGITASLDYTGTAKAVSISHAAELIGFAVASGDGRHRTEPSWAQSCVRSELSGMAPATAAFAKTGGYYPEESDYPWLSAYFSSPSLVLDPGQWTITAIAEFSDDGCGGTAHQIRASAEVSVGGTPTFPVATSLPQPSSVGPTPPAVDSAPAAFQGDGFRFTYPADWQVISGYQHMGFHGPTVAAAVGIGQFDLGCTVTSASVACGADPHWAVPDDGVVLVYRFGAWLGMCFPDPATVAPGLSRVSVGGRPAILSSSDGSMTWSFPGAPEFIEARWGPNNPVARRQVEEAVATWAWTSPSGCSGRSGAAASDQASSAPS